MLKNKVAKHYCSTKEHTNSKQPAPTIVPHAGQTQSKHRCNAMAKAKLKKSKHNTSKCNTKAKQTQSNQMQCNTKSKANTKQAGQMDIRCNAMAKKIKALATAKPRMTSRAQSIEDMFIYLPIPESLKKQLNANNYAITMCSLLKP